MRNMWSVSCPIPASAFAPGKEQPTYYEVQRGMTMSLGVMNMSDKQCAFYGRILGREWVEGNR